MLTATFKSSLLPVCLFKKHKWNIIIRIRNLNFINWMWIVFIWRIKNLIQIVLFSVCWLYIYDYTRIITTILTITILTKSKSFPCWAGSLLTTCQFAGQSVKSEQLSYYLHYLFPLNFSRESRTGKQIHRLSRLSYKYYVFCIIKCNGKKIRVQ